MSRCSPFIFGVGCYGSGGGGGGGATLTIGVFSDSGATIPITSADYEDTVYIKATATATQENFTLFIDNGIRSLLPVVAIDSSTTHIFEYTINLIGTGTLDIYVIASDNTNGIADSEPFELTVTGFNPNTIAGVRMWINGSKYSAYTFTVIDTTIASQADQTVFGNNLTSPSTSNDPAFLNTGAGINGHMSARFGVGKRLAKIGFGLDIIVGSSIFVVIRFNTSSAGVSGILLNGATASPSTPYLSFERNNNDVRTFDNTTGYSSSYPIIIGDAYVFEIHRTPTTEIFAIDGVIKHTRAIGTSGTRDDFYLGTGYGTVQNFDCGEVVIANGVVLGSISKDYIRNGLIAKWI